MQVTCLLEPILDSYYTLGLDTTDPPKQYSGRQNGLSEHIQALHGLFCYTNVLSDPIQELYTICGGKNELCEQLQASYTLSRDPN